MQSSNINQQVDNPLSHTVHVTRDRSKKLSAGACHFFYPRHLGGTHFHTDANAGYMVDTQRLALLDVESWCTAYKHGARRGCMITHINHHPIGDWADYERLAKSKEEFDMTLKFQTANLHRQAMVRSHAGLGHMVCLFGQHKRVGFSLADPYVSMCL